MKTQNRIFILLFIFIIQFYKAQPPITFSVNLTAPTCSTCCDGSACVANVSGGCNGPYTYYWSNVSGVSCQGSFCNNTTYFVTVADICYTTTATFNFSLTTGIINYQNTFQFDIFPNPIQNKFYLTTNQFNLQNINFKIINSLGSLVYSQNTILKNNEIDLSNLSIGIYFIIVQSITEQKIIKIVKQ